MSGDLQSHYGKAQRETAELFGYDLARLTPEQSMRLDCTVALRLALDDLQGRVVRGESIDVAKMLTAAEALAKLLPAAVLAAPPEEANAPDPREIMWQTYLGMRRRGELADPTSTYEGRQRRIAELEARVAELEAALAPSAPPAPAGPAPGGNVVPLKPAAAAAAPEEEYEDVVVTEVVLGQAEPWRSYVGGPDNSIISTPGKRWWGPVGS